MAPQAAEKGKYWVEKLSEFDLPRVREIRGLGLIIGIELKEKVKPFICQKILDKNIQIC